MEAIKNAISHGLAIVITAAAVTARDLDLLAENGALWSTTPAGGLIAKQPGDGWVVEIMNPTGPRGFDNPEPLGEDFHREISALLERGRDFGEIRGVKTRNSYDKDRESVGNLSLEQVNKLAEALGLVAADNAKDSERLIENIEAALEKTKGNHKVKAAVKATRKRGLAGNGSGANRFGIADYCQDVGVTHSQAESNDEKLSASEQFGWGRPHLVEELEIAELCDRTMRKDEREFAQWAAKRNADIRLRRATRLARMIVRHGRLAYAYACRNEWGPKYQRHFAWLQRILGDKSKPNSGKLDARYIKSRDKCRELGNWHHLWLTSGQVYFLKGLIFATFRAIKNRPTKRLDNLLDL
jgi:hypothetical protein